MELALLHRFLIKIFVFPCTMYREPWTAFVRVAGYQENLEILNSVLKRGKFQKKKKLRKNILKNLNEFAKIF
jgi:hypothetical protein